MKNNSSKLTKEEKLAAKLRENLRRRKIQARQRLQDLGQRPQKLKQHSVGSDGTRDSNESNLAD